MSKDMKLISKVKSGDLWFCKDCHAFHLIFNNIFLAFNQKELKRFKTYVDNLDIDYWEHTYSCSNLKRKIPLPSKQQNLVMMFNRHEILELRSLLLFLDKNHEKRPLYLNIEDIDYDFVLN